MNKRLVIIFSTIIGAIVTLASTLCASLKPEIAPYVIGIGGALNELVNIIMQVTSDKSLTKPTLITTIIGAFVTALGTCIALWKPEISAIVVGVGGALNEAINIILQAVLLPKESD